MQVLPFLIRRQGGVSVSAAVSAVSNWQSFKMGDNMHSRDKLGSSTQPSNSVCKVFLMAVFKMNSGVVLHK